MSLIFEDPEKYQQVVEKQKEEDTNKLGKAILDVHCLMSDNIESKLKALGDLFHAVRISSGLTLRAFSVESGISVVEVSDVERGLALPSDDIIKTYTKLLTKDNHATT